MVILQLQLLPIARPQILSGPGNERSLPIRFADPLMQLSSNAVGRINHFAVWPGSSKQRLLPAEHQVEIAGLFVLKNQAESNIPVQGNHKSPVACLGQINRPRSLDLAAKHDRGPFNRPRAQQLSRFR